MTVQVIKHQVSDSVEVTDAPIINNAGLAAIGQHMHIAGIGRVSSDYNLPIDAYYERLIKKEFYLIIDEQELEQGTLLKKDNIFLLNYNARLYADRSALCMYSDKRLEKYIIDMIKLLDDKNYYDSDNPEVIKIINHDHCDLIMCNITTMYNLLMNCLINPLKKIYIKNKYNEILTLFS
jgi:hypothetical protein